MHATRETNVDRTPGARLPGRTLRHVTLALFIALCASAVAVPIASWAAGHKSRPISEHHERGARLAGRGRLTAIPGFAKTAAEPGAAGTASMTAAKPPSPPFRECPAIGVDQSCGILIYVTNSGAQVLSDPSQGPYDGGDDTLIGIVNESSKPLSSISLSSNTDIFGFDGDGICSYSSWTGDEKCPYGPTGYEGPGTHFGENNGNSGPVVFSPTLAAGGGSAYFGLENALSQATLVNTHSYAAIGDSYSSGVGTEDSAFSASCDRSPKAWPMLLGSDAGLSIVGNPSSTADSFFACSGATSTQELKGDASHNQPDQVLELEKYAAKNSTPGLVTITAGGDDMKFADLLETCYIWGGLPCSSALRGGISYLTNGQKSFEQRLRKLYEGAANAAGPGARVEIVGYPRIFPSSLSWLQLLHHCDWLATVPSGLNLIHQITIDLDNDIRQAAGQAHVGFASTENAMAGHELCTGESWLASLGPINGLVKHISGHPELRGQEAMASTVLQDMRSAGLPFVAMSSAKPKAHSAAAKHNVHGTPQLAEAGLTIAVAEAPNATVGGPYLGYLVASGGTEPYAWSISKGSLPPGLTLDPSTGVISGEPTTSGTSELTVTVTDAGAPAATASKSISITSAARTALSVTSTILPTATAGQQYETLLNSTGGTRPVTWKLESGSLPPGLSLDPETGTIAGTPSASGQAKVTVRATDAAEPAQSATATVTLTTVPESELLAVTATKPPAGKAGEYYGLTLNSTGGTAPITWAVSSGTLPEGLTLDPSSGEISGLPSAPGIYPVTVAATDRSTPTARTASVELKLVIEAASHLAILTPTLPAAIQGSEYVATLNAEGGVSSYSWQVTSGNLPPGLSLENSSGTIEGTPTESGSFTFTATVNDGSTPAPQGTGATYTITVAASSPTVTFTPPEATVNVPYSYTPEANGGVEPYSWSLSSGELPVGLSLDEATGTISGIPTSSGSSPLTLRLADSSQPSPQSISAVGTLTVGPAPPLRIESAGIPGGINGLPYRSVVFVSGGTEPFAFSIKHGSLPPGVSLDPSSGVLAGTPEAEGSFEFTVQVSDASQPSQSRTASFTLTVGPPPALSIATTELAEANAGTGFAQTLIATGGTAPYIWSISSGTLPPGVTLSESTGELAGTPTGSGSFSFTAQTTDSSLTPQTASVALTLTVNPASPLSLTTTSLSAGTQGVYYDQPIEAQGGVAPYEWSLSSGSLPEGLSLDPTSGTIYGVPTSYGTSSVTVQVSDASSPSREVATQKLTLMITAAPPLSVPATSLPVGMQGQYYDQSLGISGGVSPYTVTVSAGSLPEGLSINQYGDVYGEITSEHSETFTLSIRDGSTPHAQAVSRSYTIEVTRAGPLELSSVAAPFVIGQYNEDALAVTGGVPGYSWTVDAIKLPSGLSFSGGYIYGTPTKTGKGTVTVTLTDSATPTAHTVTKTLTVKVGKPPKLKITTKKLPNAVHGTYYQQAIGATGGSPPDSWSLSAGTLPPGMSQSGEWVYGTPETAGTYSFTIKVTDSGSPTQQTATKKLTLKVS
jgi:hypothetical protein